METKSIVRGVRLSADKGRLVADLVRGKKVDQALNILTFSTKAMAVEVRKTPSPGQTPDVPRARAPQRARPPRPRRATDGGEC